jgi:hypothetical protein
VGVSHEVNRQNCAVIDASALIQRNPDTYKLETVRRLPLRGADAKIGQRNVRTKQGGDEKDRKLYSV